MESAHDVATPPALERPAISSPRNPFGERMLQFYMGTTSLLLVAIFVVVLCPALTSTWWHMRHEGRFVWRETRFELPIAWSVSRPPMAQRDQVMLIRRSWFVFASPALNTLFLSSPNPRMYLRPEDEMQAMAANGQPVSAFSKLIAGRTFRCLSEPDRSRGFSFGGAQIHARCDLEGPGWELDYYGSPALLDEGLGIVARGEPVAD